MGAHGTHRADHPQAYRVYCRALQLLMRRAEAAQGLLGKASRLIQRRKCLIQLHGRGKRG